MDKVTLWQATGNSQVKTCTNQDLIKQPCLVKFYWRNSLHCTWLSPNPSWL